MEGKAIELIQKARPYLPGLPEEVRVVPWPEEVPPEVLGLSLESEEALTLKPGLEGEERRLVLLHELLHLAEPLLPERWVRVLDRALLYALERDLPPRDVPSLAWLSLEEAVERLAPPPPSDPGLFPGPLGGLYERLGILPDEEGALDPYYLMVQVAHGLPYTGWVLERLWPEPPLTRREAARRIFRFAQEAGEEAWKKVEGLLGLDLFPEPALGRVRGIPKGVPPGRLRGVLRLVEAVLLDPGQGEAYEPPEAGDPEEVVAGLIAEGRLGWQEEQGSSSS